MNEVNTICEVLKHDWKWYGQDARNKEVIDQCSKCKKKAYRNKRIEEEENTQIEIDIKISIAEKAAKREKSIEYQGHKSMIRWLWSCRGQSANPSEVYIAKLADSIIKSEKQWAVQTTARALGFDTKTRDQITDYRRRRVPRIQVGKTKLYLVPYNQGMGRDNQISGGDALSKGDPLP